MPKTVLCENLEGDAVPVPSAQLVFKPIAFAVVVFKRQLLVTRLPNNELELPGQALRPAEAAPQVAERLIRRRTGMRVQLTAVPFYCHERFLYRLKRGWHSHCFYYHAWLLTPGKRTRRGVTEPPDLKAGFSWWSISHQRIDQLDAGARAALGRYIADGRLG